MQNPFLAVLWMFSRFELSSTKSRFMLFGRFKFLIKFLIKVLSIRTIDISTPSNFFQFLVFDSLRYDCRVVLLPGQLGT